MNKQQAKESKQQNRSCVRVTLRKCEKKHRSRSNKKAKLKAGEILVETLSQE